MPHHPSPVTHIDADVGPERLLIAAVVRQVVLDARSRQPAIRAEAVAFLANTPALTVWADLLEVEVSVLRAYVHRTLEA